MNMSFDAISASNSTMVENFKNVDPEIPINAMRCMQ